MQKTVTFGGPGTGKTFTLLTDLRSALHRYPPHEIAVLTFSRAATAEILKRLGIPKSEACRSWGTFHSVISRMLGLGDIGYITDDHRLNWCRQMGIEFTPRESDGEGTYFSDSSSMGGSIFSAFSLAVNTHPDDPQQALPDEVTHSSPEGTQTIYHRELLTLYDSWDGHKQELGLLDYSDILLIGSKETYHFPAIFVDEFQDLSPLQYTIYLRMLQGADEAWIYGDDDQNIYEDFIGSQSAHLLAERNGADIRILDRSYRLPTNLLDYLSAFISANTIRQPKNIAPVSHGGTLQNYEGDSLETLVNTIPPGESAFFLTQARYMAAEISRQLTEALVVHRRIGGRTAWDGNFGYYADCLLSLLHHTSINEFSLVTTLKTTTNILVRGQKKYTENRARELKALLEIPNDSATWPPQPAIQNQVDARYFYNLMGMRVHEANLPQTILQAMDISYPQQCVLAKIVAGEPFELKPPRIAVGTIHGAKGAEADHIFLSTVVTRRFISSTNPELNRRVFYVGGSRARKRLVLLSSVNLVTPEWAPFESIPFHYIMPPIPAAASP